MAKTRNNAITGPNALFVSHGCFSESYRYGENAVNDVWKLKGKTDTKLRIKARTEDDRVPIPDCPKNPNKIELICLVCIDYVGCIIEGKGPNRRGITQIRRIK